MVCGSIILIGFLSIATIASGLNPRKRDVADSIVFDANVSEIELEFNRFRIEIYRVFAYNIQLL